LLLLKYFRQAQSQIDPEEAAHAFFLLPRSTNLTLSLFMLRVFHLSASFFGDVFLECLAAAENENMARFKLAGPIDPLWKQRRQERERDALVTYYFLIRANFG
jgi:hypothetical protein